MSKEKRIEYLACTLSVVVAGFVLFGIPVFLGVAEEELGFKELIACGCLGGIMFGGIVSTLILSTRFFKKQSLSFKILACVLWPFTAMICMYIGVFSYIPYQIYNIVKIFQMTKEEKQQSLITAPAVMENIPVEDESN